MNMIYTATSKIKSIIGKSRFSSMYGVVSISISEPCVIGAVVTGSSTTVPSPFLVKNEKIYLKNFCKSLPNLFTKLSE